MRIELEEVKEEKSSGWSKEFPKVQGSYWARRLQTGQPEPKVIEVCCDAGEWFAYRAGNARDIDPAKFIESEYEFLGPISPSDTEELFKLREAAENALTFMEKWFGEHPTWTSVEREKVMPQLRKALGKE